VIKEYLRIDSPAIYSVSNKAYSDVTICGAKISKEQQFKYAQLAVHYDENE
jgi:cytochrome P450